MRRVLLFCVVVLVSSALLAQDKEFGIHFSGFVKTDFFYDTRQTVSIREGHFNLYPQNELFDAFGSDLNATPSFNILSIQTRLTGTIKGPDAFGAKTSGMIEGAFFGQNDADINGYRLRHAFVKLKWSKADLLLGQFWHPMFVHESFPTVISFNTGTPFQPFSRNPQIRAGYQLWKLNFFAAALAQRDFLSPGPLGASSVYLRNSALPEVHAQLQFKHKTEKDLEIMLGAGGGYKTLAPRIVNSKNVKVDEKVSGYNAMAFLKISNPVFTAKMQAVYGQNVHDLTMLGGYAIEYYYDTNLRNLDERSYTNLDVNSYWFEFNTNGKRFQPGIFAGYTVNKGSLHNIHDWKLNDSYFARGANIAYVYRFAPRVVFISGKTRFALEVERTTAAYAKSRNSLGDLSDLKEVTNTRFLFSAIYLF